MKILVSENEKLKRKFLKYLMKLPPEQFLGVTTILNVKLTEEEESMESAADAIENSHEVAPVEEGDTSIEEKDTSMMVENAVGAENDKESQELEERKDKAKEALSILYECLEKFEALTLVQKKTLLKLVRAGV